MKKNLLIIALMLICLFSFAQQKPKPKVKEKPPTQKEMEEMMKELQKEMDGMSPEEKKMMDSMGIKMPSMKNIPKLTDKHLADAWEKENQIVPIKDVARIAAIPKSITDARLGAYITSIQNKAVAFLKPEVKNMAAEIYSYIKLNTKNSTEAGNMTIGLWIAGNTEMAYYTLGKICADDPANTDNLSNYASMLSTLGAQHLAIPILNNLNTKFTKNSSLLNNLGQAWFGLGELVKAEKYLDSTIRIYAYHPQANLTKAAIEESKGNISKAIEALQKSIKHSYTSEKEEKLSKLGYKLRKADVRLPFKPSADPLGLGRFRQPDYPKSVSELIALKPQWEAFDLECDEEIAKLKNELSEVEVKLEQNLDKKMAQTMQAVKSGGIIPAQALVPLFATKALLVLQDMESQNELTIKKQVEMFLALTTQLDQLQKTRKRPAPEAPCEAHIKAQDEFLNNYNTLKQSYNNEVLKQLNFYSNGTAYWSQYTCTHETQFEAIRLNFMIGWLEKLKEYRPLLTAGGYEIMVPECVEKKDAKPGKLGEFDDIACEYKSKIDYTIVKIETNCSHTTTTYNFNKIKYTERELGQNYIGGTIILKPKISADVSIGPLGVEIFAGAEINIELDQSKDVKDWNGTISTGLETGVGISKGPLKTGVSVTEAIEIEISAKGVGDVNVVTKAEASIGAKVGPLGKSVEIGVESRASLVTGKVTESGTGLLTNITMPEW